MPSIHSIHAQSHSCAYAHSSAAANQRDSAAPGPCASSLATARQAVEQASDVREQRVADIKRQISDGTYRVSSRVLARKILAQQSRY